MRYLVRAFAVLAALVAVDAWAQMNYVVSSTPQTYVPLSGTGVTPITSQMTTGGFYPARDEGYYDLPLGFTFPYFGNTYTNVGINSNGILVFGATANAECDYSNGFSTNCTYGNSIPNTTRSPHNVIAPWWSDHEGNSGGDIRYFQPNPSEMVIEFYDWNNYSNPGGSFSFQVRLNASGLFQIHYGPKAGTFDGIAGFEDSTGNMGEGLFTCSTSGFGCSDSDWPADTLFTIGQPVQPDLMVQAVTNTTIKNGSDLDLTVTATFRNLGKNDATGFHWKAYLSTDKLLDTATDTLFFDSSVSGASVTVQGADNTTNPVATATGSGTVTNVANGNYYVLVEADSTDVVAEYSETNNVGATANYFTFGIDLVANAISGPAETGPGNTESLQIDWFNQGTDPAPADVEFQVVLSADQTFDPATDFVVGGWSESVAGTQTCSPCTKEVEIPGNVPGGDYYFGVVIDPNAQVTEAKTNNVAFASALTHVSQADLQPVKMELVDPLTLQPTRMALIGGTAAAAVTLSNVGGADAKNFTVAILISSNSNPSLLNDTIAYDAPVELLAAGATQKVTFNFPIPSVDKNGNPLASGSYFLFAYVDSYSDVTELSENNNTRGVTSGAGLLEPVQLRTPASDYAVVSVDVPAAAAVGEVVPVYRLIRNAGNADGSAVTYRYYASANEILSTDDLALPIIGANGQVEEAGEVTLESGASDAYTDLVRIPPTLPAGTWFIGCVVDVAETETELSELNNAGYSGTAIQVAPSALRITTQQLPDATVDLGYAFKLGVTGAQAPVTWAVDGELPAELELDPATGVVSGTPIATSISAFTVVAQNDTQAAAARLVMRVMPSSGELSVTTAALPPAIATPSSDYLASFAAAGGAQPYAWTVLSGSFPNGLSMDVDGRVSGNVKPGVQVGEFPLLVEVVDSVGNRARAEVKLRVVEPGALLITTLSVPEVAVGTDYIADFSAHSADSSPLATPLTWTIISGRLPEGLAFTVAQGELGLLTGKPHEAGSFPFSVEVVDAKGRSDVADYVLRVHPTRLKLSAVNPPAELHPGDEVNFQITTGSTESRYRLFSGTLPPGLSLDEAGVVSGTVGDEGSLGLWSFVVQADSATAGESLGAFALEVTAVPVKAGCSASGGSPVGMFLLLAPLGLLMLRRRRVAGALAAVAAVAVLAAPGAAHAQSQPYQLGGPTTAPYVPLAGGTALNIDTYSGTTVSIPFDFEFYGATYDSVGVSMNGYLAFIGDLGSYYHAGIPHNDSYYPTVLVAPWWDELDASSTGGVKAQVIGTAPNRELVVEWKDVQCVSWDCFSTSKFSFQVHLLEGSNVVRFAYGNQAPPSGSAAAVGIMGGAGIGLSGLPSCTTTSSGTCGPTHFPSGQVLEFTLPPNLKVSSFSSEDIGYGGVAFPGTAEIANRGGRNALGAQVRFYLSEDPNFDPVDDLPVGDSNVVSSLSPNGSAVVTAALQFSASLTPGNYFLFAAADPDDLVEEDQHEDDNVSVPRLFTVAPPTPDLEIDSLQGPATAQGGGSFMVTPDIRNTGNADTTVPVTVTYFVSDNSVVTVSDIEVGTDQVGPMVAGGASFTTARQVTLPGSLHAGKYWIGACVDYDAAATPRSSVQEIDEVDNCFTGSPFVLDTGALAVITESLPMATQNAPFGLSLEAAGGDGSYTWSIASGEVPPGMQLSAEGLFAGTPSDAGEFSFTVKVVSDGEEQTRALSLTVQPKDLPFAIGDQTLPPAEFGRGYQTQLVARGGRPPYTWALKEGSRLPDGLALAADGLIEGRASKAGEDPVTFTVTATDQAGTVSARDLQLLVTLPSSMHIATTRLEGAVLGKGYKQDLFAVGGQPPYQWSVVQFQKLAQDITEVPGTQESKIPDNFGIKLLSSGDGAQLTGKASQAGLFTITFRVQDNAGAEDLVSLPLRITYEQPLAITTLVLPDAFVGQPYSVRLSHNLDAEEGVTFSSACVEQANSSSSGYTYGCVAPDALQQLPIGLILGADGAISGAAGPLPETATSPGVDSDGKPLPRSTIYSFLVKAQDASGRSDLRSLSIKVRELPAEKSGCSGTGVGPVALSLLALAGLFARSRRRVW